MRAVAYRLSALLLAVLCCASPASAVILYSAAQRNTDAPTGDLLNSGWQYEGDFNGFLGTPIAPHYFITAQHIGGEANPTNTFLLNGGTYTINTPGNYFDSPNSDLRIWKINETFPSDSIAPLFNTDIDGSEVGKSLVVIGRGTQRGDPITVDDQLKGWAWGSWDSVRSWGENTVSAVVNDPTYGDLLTFGFNSDGGPNESMISGGDSGGGVFIQSNGVWKLAGINLAADDPWRLTADGTDINAAIFDGSGLYFQLGDPPSWQLLTDPVAAESYATLISSNLIWIESIIGPTDIEPAPEPATGTIAILAAFTCLTRRARRN